MQNLRAKFNLAIKQILDKDLLEFKYDNEYKESLADVARRTLASDWFTLAWVEQVYGYNPMPVGLFQRGITVYSSLPPCV